MHVPVHLALSWLIGHQLRERRDRRLVAWSGVVPDLDALSLLAGHVAYVEYHHLLTHGLVAAVAGALLWTALARQRLKVLALTLVAFHVHLLCDLVGSGFEGEKWPIYYFYPFSYYELLSPYGWDLASPQNVAVWLAVVAATIWIGIVHGRTFVETFLPARADGAVVERLRRLAARWRGRSHSN